MHTVFALLCFVVVIPWLIFPYPSGLLHWHCGNLTIAPVPAKQPWWIWINTSCEFIMNDCITTTKQSTTKPCAYFLGYTVCGGHVILISMCKINPYHATRNHDKMWRAQFLRCHWIRCIHYNYTQCGAQTLALIFRLNFVHLRHRCQKRFFAEFILKSVVFAY